MEIVIGAALLAIGLVAAGNLLGRGRLATANGHHADPADGETGGREAELARSRERSQSLERSLDRRADDLDRRADDLDRRAEHLEAATLLLQAEQEEVAGLREDHTRALERAAGLSAGQAKQALLKEVEEQAAPRRRPASCARSRRRPSATPSGASATILAVVHAAPGRQPRRGDDRLGRRSCPSDDMKGRIIGREGRNIRALENLTGVDFIIDDTPGRGRAVSAFDGVRREVARMTLEKLLQDGRIHPARIEEIYYQVEVRARVAHHRARRAGGASRPASRALAPRADEDPRPAALPHELRAERARALVECAQLAAMMAHELGASPKTARRAALLHDIGKAVSHEIEGPHALVGGDLARRYGEPEAVAHAMEAHHNEVEPQTVEAVIVQAADALSGARPGARGESLEQYVKRLRDLEQIATRHEGVDKVYAMQAGREIRVMVAPRGPSTTTRPTLLVARDRPRDREASSSTPARSRSR